MDKKLTLILFDTGAMSALYKAGFIGVKPFLYRDIYLFVDAQIQTRGINKTKAVYEAAEKFGKTETTIWNALKSFE